MEFFDLKFEENTGRRYESALCEIEAKFKVSITVHDLFGKLGDIYDNPLLPGRHLHAHPCCRRGRDTVSGWDQKCGRECFGNAERHAGKVLKPYLKDCYKGLRELVIPVIANDSHQMTLFAGVFRGVTPPDEIMPDWFPSLYQTLPEADPAQLQQLAEILRLLGLALLAEANAVPPGTGDRLAQIRHFIFEHAHENISLNDLAGEMYISSSRTGHLVRLLAGRSFGELLKEERMLRARRLLLNTDRKLNDIAEAVGYPNCCYFNRVFQQFFGCPPGRYRTNPEHLLPDRT